MADLLSLSQHPGWKLFARYARDKASESIERFLAIEFDKDAQAHVKAVQSQKAAFTWSLVNTSISSMIAELESEIKEIEEKLEEEEEYEEDFDEEDDEEE